MKKTVSVIVPAYNAEQTIEKCIDGILNQTYKPTEIIIIDDGSTDSTSEILSRYEKENMNVIVLHQSNAGVSSARNAGLKRTSSDYIVFIDCDDVVEERYIETLLFFSEYDYVTCGFHIQDAQKNWRDIVFEDEAQTIDVIRTHPSTYLGKYYFGSPWAKLFSKSIIEENGLWFHEDVHKGEDILFNMEYLSFARNVRIVPMCDYYYTFQEASLSHSRHPYAWKWRIDQERVINDFFCSTDEKEVLFILNRDFDLLQMMIGENSNCNSIIREIYTDPFFKECIHHKKTTGSFGERLLLVALEYNHYDFFIKCFHFITTIRCFLVHNKKTNVKNN